MATSTSTSAPAANGTATYLPLPDAAQLLGLSQSALRRRLRAGKAHGERRPTSSGFAWWVAVDGETPSAERAAPTAPRTPTPGRTPTAPRAESVLETPGPTTLAVQVARAAEMATYSEKLLAPVLARLEAQAERIGRLEADNDALRARVAELAAAKVERNIAIAMPGIQVGALPEGRRWWRRVGAWLSPGRPAPAEPPPAGAPPRGPSP